MAVSVSPMIITEIPICAEIYLEAFAQDAFSLAAFPRETTAGFAQWWVSMDLAEFQAQGAARFVKATIDDQIIAFAKWNIPKENEDGEIMLGGDDPDHLPVYPAGTNRELADKFLGTLATKRKDIMSTRPHCYLEMVATRPEYRGRGAASKLIAWGLEIADKMGLEAYLEGNEENIPLYQKFGFKVVDEYRLEELNYLESFMLRPAR